MKKLLLLILTLIFILLSGCAESGNSAQGSSSRNCYVFTDDLGREVAVESPERVAALLGSYADIWLLAGGDICASADDAWEDLGLELSEDAVNLGKTQSPSKESLLAASPDLVLASPKLSAHLEMRETLEAAGIAVAYFDVSDFEDYLRVLKICTDITGKPERFEQYGTALEAQINAILERNEDKEPQSVLVARASAASIRVKDSEGTMLGGMLNDFGCVNIADSDSSLLEALSVESILLKDPDKIFFVQAGDSMEEVEKAVAAMFEENPLWNELTAVKNGEVHFMDKRLYNLKPNARFAEAYENLETILYDE